MSRRRAGAHIVLPLLLAGGVACGTGQGPGAVRPERPFPVLEVSAEGRVAALARAAVWHEPEVPVEEVDLGSNPRGARALPEELTCTFVARQTQGMTPKVHCTLPGGELVKIKYGRDNGEVFAEVAASRLLRALGFGADDMYVIRRVHCLGCAPPDAASWVVHLFTRQRDVVYNGVALERRFPGPEIRTAGDEGWAWFELDEALSREAPRDGSRARWDALRLMAILLAHWDNKAPNQRLACLPGEAVGGHCTRPLAFVQDLGATFGPAKVDLERWRAYPVWADAATCTVSMKPLPFGGATFADARIGEEGRRFLAERLGRLTAAQMRRLFEGARFPEFTRHSREARDPGAWVAALQDKIRQIAERPPCPAP